MIPVPKMAYLLVGACPICTRSDLHSHPVPVPIMLSLLGAAEAHEPTPEIQRIEPEPEPIPPPPHPPTRPGDTPTLVSLLVVLVTALTGELGVTLFRIIFWFGYVIHIYRTGQWPEDTDKEEASHA